MHAHNMQVLFVLPLQVVHRVGVFDTADDASDDDVTAAGSAAGVKGIR